jgi:Tol biopolymer transport system component
VKASRKWLALVAGAFAVVAFMPAAQAAAPLTFSGTDGPIVFASDRGGGGLELYSMNAHGSNLTQLTFSPDGTANSYPDFSPDGRFIAFSSDRSHPGGQNEIFAMHADGTNLHHVTHEARNGPTNDLEPAYSPDGTQVVFSRCYSDGCAIWIMNSDGTGQTALTEHTINGNFSPQFSPDGSLIAFIRHPHKPPVYKSAVYTMRPDGSHDTPVTPRALQAAVPDWTPDGSRILFTTNAVVPHSSQMTIRPDGTGLKQLTNPPADHNDFDGVNAPLGDRVAFTSDRSGYPDIWIVDSDGSKLHDVTKTPDFLELWPDWGTAPGP